MEVRGPGSAPAAEAAATTTRSLANGARLNGSGTGHGSFAEGPFIPVVARSAAAPQDDGHLRMRAAGKTRVMGRERRRCRIGGHPSVVKLAPISHQFRCKSDNDVNRPTGGGATGAPGAPVSQYR